MKAQIKRERPSLTGFRLYKEQRNLINKIAKKYKISKAEVVRRAINLYAKN